MRIRASGSKHRVRFFRTVQGNHACGNSLQINGNIINRQSKRAGSTDVTSRAVRVLPQKLCSPFLGRQDEHARIVDALTRSDDNRPSLCVIWGTIGVGKTQLARRCLEGIDPSIHVLWLKASSSEDLDKSISQVLKKLKTENDQDSLMGRWALTDWLEERGRDSQEWLLVLDDVRRTTFTTALEIIPSAMHRGRVLITTRTHDLALKVVSPYGDAQSCIELRELDVDHAYDLFMHVLGDNRNGKMVKDHLRESGDMENRVKEIVTLLGCIPLAIYSAANYTQKETLDATREEVARLFDWEDVVLTCYGYRFYQQRPALKYALDSFWELEEMRTPEFDSLKAILYITSFLNPNRISVRLLRHLDVTAHLWTSKVVKFFRKPSRDLRYSIIELENLSLLTRFDGGQSFGVHTLLQPLARSDRYVRQAVKTVCGMSPTDLAECHEILLHVKSIFKYIGESHPCKGLRLDLLRKKNELGEFLLESHEYAGAEKVFEETYQDRCHISTPSTEQDILQSIENLAFVLLRQRRYSKAKKSYRDALDIRKKLPGGRNHPDTLIIRDRLASIFEFEEEYEDAEIQYRVTLDEREKVLGLSHPQTLATLDKLGSVLLRQGRLDAAQDQYREALDRRLDALGDRHPDTLGNRDKLAQVLQSQRLYIEAEEQYREALQTRVDTLGYQSYDTLATYDHLASALRHQGRYEEAEKYYRRALSGRRSVLEKEDRDILATLHNLAAVLNCQERYEEAEEYYKMALSEGQSVSGEIEIL